MVNMRRKKLRADELERDIVFEVVEAALATKKKRSQR
jgi:hypothetical protein